MRFRLQDNDRRAGLCGGDCGGEARRAATRNDDIGYVTLVTRIGGLGVGNVRPENAAAHSCSGDSGSALQH
jgi:hypothetical protein